MRPVEQLSDAELVMRGLCLLQDSKEPLQERFDKLLKVLIILANVTFYPEERI